MYTGAGGGGGGGGGSYFTKMKRQEPQNRAHFGYTKNKHRSSQSNAYQSLRFY